MPDLAARIGGAGKSAIGDPAFRDSFAVMASPRSVRGGDVNPLLWSTARFTPDGVSVPRPNHVRQAVIPVGIRSTFTDGIPVAADGYGNPAGELVYPPNDLLIQDAAGARAARLMMAIVIQEYGHVALMARQPFDFADGYGIIECTVDAWSEGTLGTYPTIDITSEPVPATSFGFAQNQEPGPRAASGLFIQWSGGALGTANTIGMVFVYDDFGMTQITPTFEVTGGNRPLVTAGSLNRIQIRLSSTRLIIYESDCSLDDGLTFPNFRRIYEADLDLPFTRGYVHVGARNHSTTKFFYPFTSVYYWGFVAFNGPVLPRPRAYEVDDNHTTGHNSSPPVGLPEYDYQRLAYEVSDGVGRQQGLWNAADTPAHISPFSIPSVNLAGATSATLTLNCFVNAVSQTPTTSWGIKTRFNSTTWRTRLLTATEVNVLDTDLGSAGYLALAIDVPLGDLVTGTNTLEFDMVNIPMDFAPMVLNIDLLVNT
jgi:hypothetical protein